MFEFFKKLVSEKADEKPKEPDLNHSKKPLSLVTVYGGVPNEETNRNTLKK